MLSPAFYGRISLLDRQLCRRGCGSGFHIIRLRRRSIRRSEERLVGKECLRLCIARWSSYHETKQTGLGTSGSLWINISKKTSKMTHVQAEYHYEKSQVHKNWSVDREGPDTSVKRRQYQSCYLRAGNVKSRWFERFFLGSTPCAMLPNVLVGAYAGRLISGW